MDDEDAQLLEQVSKGEITQEMLTRKLYKHFGGGK